MTLVLEAPSRATRKSRDQHVAGDPAHNVWVAASAGSGKTSVLVDRILRLLIGGCDPAKLLCLTFTRAAAAEMADRLFGALSGWTVMDDAALGQTLTHLTGAPARAGDLLAARRLFARVLDTPGGLKVQTIHGFCEALLARFPLEAGQAPNFEVLDERKALDLLAAVRDEVLRDAADDEPLREALTTVSERAGEFAFLNLLGALVLERGRLDQLIQRYGLEGLVEKTFAHLGIARDETDGSAVAQACAGGFNEPGLRQVAAALLQASNTDRDRGTVIDAWLRQPETRAATFAGYAQAYLTKQGEVQKRLCTKETLERLPDAKRILETEADRLVAVEQRRKSIGIARATAALLVLGHAILTRYAAAKRARNALDYDDLILRSRTLLTQVAVTPWVLFKLDGGIDHILVDEAQDTSPEQWEIVAALAEEFFAGRGARDVHRTVFVVGDEKQSIYSFQGADPRAFEDMRHFFRDRAASVGTRWEEVPLAVSYRSVPAVLTFVDRVFASRAARDGVTSADDWGGHTAHRTGSGGLVELWPTVATTRFDGASWELPVAQMLATTAQARLAQRIARTIRRWLETGERLTARDRAIRPEDIMILVRRRGLFFEEMVLALKQAGVPVAGADRMVLTHQLVVEDLVALGRLILLPEDDLTCAAVLKGPLCGFDDALLFDLAYGREASLWATLWRRRGEREDFAAAASYLGALMARADYVTPFDFYAGVLGDGGRSKLLSRLGREAEDPMDEFMARALAYEREHTPSLEGFLHWIEVDEAEVKRDLEQARNQVRVMTVHGAKGLEAPIVFLPDTCAPPIEDPPVFWSDDSDEALLLWPGRKDLDSAASREARERTRGERDREYRRLLYVALTRAEDRLYVCGWESQRGRGAGCWYDLAEAAMRDFATPASVDFGDGLGLQTVLRHETAQEATIAPDAREKDLPFSTEAVPAWARRPAPAEPVPPRPLAPSRPSEGEPRVRSPRQDDDGSRFRRGNAIHRLLQFLPDVEPERRAAVAGRFLAQPALGFDAARQQAIAAELLAVLDDPVFAPVFAPGALAEAPVAGIVREAIVSGQIDRLAVRDDEVLIVDFKTNRDPPANDDDVPAAYVRQMAIYRAVLARIYPDRPVRCALLWTDGPRLTYLPEERLAAAF